MAHKISKSERVGEAHEVLAAGGPYQLDARLGKPTRCIRRITVLADGEITALLDAQENDEPPGAVTAGMVFDGDYSSVTADCALYIQW